MAEYISDSELDDVEGRSFTSQIINSEGGCDFSFEDELNSDAVGGLVDLLKNNLITVADLKIIYDYLFCEIRAFLNVRCECPCIDFSEQDRENICNRILEVLQSSFSASIGQAELNSALRSFQMLLSGDSERIVLDQIIDDAFFDASTEYVSDAELFRDKLGLELTSFNSSLDEVESMASSLQVLREEVAELVYSRIEGHSSDFSCDWPESFCSIVSFMSPVGVIANKFGGLEDLKKHARNDSGDCVVKFVEDEKLKIPHLIQVYDFFMYNFEQFLLRGQLDLQSKLSEDESRQLLDNLVVFLEKENDCFECFEPLLIDDEGLDVLHQIMNFALDDLRLATISCTRSGGGSASYH